MRTIDATGLLVLPGIIDGRVHRDQYQREDITLADGFRSGTVDLSLGPYTRFIGENSIVGAGTTIVFGVAMANVAHRSELTATADILLGRV